MQVFWHHIKGASSESKNKGITTIPFARRWKLTRNNKRNKDYFRKKTLAKKEKETKGEKKKESAPCEAKKNHLTTFQSDKLRL